MQLPATETTRSPVRLLALGLVLALSLAVQSVAAQTTRFVAPTGADAGNCSDAASPCQTVGYAISESENGDVLELAAGEYTESLEIIGLELTIRGAGDGAGGTILQAHPEDPESASDRVMFIRNGAEVTIESVWVRHGNASGSGGGIWVFGASALTLTDSTVSHNRASAGGGGISFEGTELSITRSRILNNQALGTLAFTGGGGGIRSANGSTVVLVESTVDGNLAVVHSGGIRINGSGASPSSMTVDRSTISNNATDAPGAQTGNGGGIFANGATDLVVVNSTLSGNSGGNGTAIFFPVTGGTGSRSLTLINSTITNNQGRSDDGAVRFPGAAVSVVSNTIIADQQGLTRDCANPGGSTGHNLSSDDSCAFIEPGDLQNANAALGPLAENGGSTLTHTLLAGSAAVGAGDPDVCAAPPVNGMDQRGEIRGTEACAMGAVEAAPSEPEPEPEPEPAPMVIAIDPDSGPVAGGTAVTITGENFEAGAGVRLGASDCMDIAVLDSSTIACSTPPGPEGPIDVVVENPDGQSGTLNNGYTYLDEPEPEPILSITGVDPDRGPEAGGTSVTVSGTGFQEGAEVNFGAAPCRDVIVVDDTEIDCITPAGPPGPVDVSVINPDKEQAVLPDGFTYLPDDDEDEPTEAVPVPLLDWQGLLLLMLLVLVLAAIRIRA